MKQYISRKKLVHSLRLSLRFVVPLAASITLLAYITVPLMEQLTLRWFVRDLDIRSRLITSTLQDTLIELVEQGNKSKVNRLLQRSIQDERLLSLGYCTNEGVLLYSTPNFPKSVGCKMPTGAPTDPASMIRLSRGPVHIAVNPLEQDGVKIGSLVLVHDMSFVERRSSDSRKYLIMLFVLLGAITSLIAVLVAYLSRRGWIEGVRAMLRGEGILRPFSQPDNPDLQPLAGDLRALLRSLDAERHFADDATISWTPDTLRSLLHKELTGDQVIVVSNREPYMHMRGKKGIEISRPASGLVTAVEPVMRACSGIWIAHGSGTADKEATDKHGRVGVPPDHPDYTLRRIWLTPEEEDGYYYGFANEGMWPLCHIAHVRPIFRTSDWGHYVSINQRFADAVAMEARSDDPVVLVQDYHFALLPAMIRSILPKATLITFWHIPWPNPESFGICPWREELLQGMLGSTILGFHTRFHCKNFLETVDRYLETRIEHESSTISHGGMLTLVENYPISIQWPPPWRQSQPSIAECRSEVQRSLNLSDDTLIGLGVDRMDYTKGILERLMAVERLLERHPDMVGRFVFIQIAAPSRSALEEYQAFDARVHTVVARINERFSKESYQPIFLKAEHHEPEEINRYYRAADVCMVTSLHDGMNLVAKEYVAARDDERGVLLLSQFTGAAQELHEALIVNPYHVEQTADALYRGLIMPDYEQRERIRSMRALVRNFNVYRWAGRMLIDAARIRQREKLATRIGRPL